jgi:hypothetical protein
MHRRGGNEGRKWCKRQTELDHVVENASAGVRLDQMDVVPLGERPACLLVAEAAPVDEVVVNRDPAQRGRSGRHAQHDGGAFVAHAAAGGLDLDAAPWRHETRQGAGPRVPREDFGWRQLEMGPFAEELRCRHRAPRFWQIGGFSRRDLRPPADGSRRPG